MAEKNIKEMSFLDHLEELRWLLVRSSAAIILCGIVAFFFSDFIFNEIIFGPKSPDFVTYQFFCDLGKQFDMAEMSVTSVYQQFINEIKSFSAKSEK